MHKLPNLCNPFDMTTNNADQEKMICNSERKQESATKNRGGLDQRTSFLDTIE